MKKITKTSGIIMVLLYTIYSFFVFNFPLILKFYEVLAPQSVRSFFFLFSIASIAFLLCFILYLLASHKLFKILFLFINALVFYFIFSYNILIDTEMVGNTFSTDVNEVRDLLSFKLFLFILIFAVLPSILLFFIEVKRSAFVKKLICIFISILLAALLFLANFVTSAGFFRVNRNFGDMFIPFNYLASIVSITNKHFKNPEKPENDLEFPDLKIDLTQDITVVLVVGETARKKNFSLYGYIKETNPELSKIQDLHILQNAVSCGTSTKISIPCIFKTKPNYESTIKALGKSGINIKWYENNFGGCYLMCDEVETFYSDHSKCDGSCPDGVIFEKFYKDLTLAKSGVNLFILHQNGSHGPLYYKRYPGEFAKFKPECKTPNVADCSMEELINAYDNSILYTDFLIAETIQKLKDRGGRSVLIYASDHGESLGENGIFLHGFPYSIAPKEQMEIPYIIWSSFPLEIKPQEIYEHKTIMPSILRLINANPESYNKQDAIL